MIQELDLNTLPADFDISKVKALNNWKLVQVEGTTDEVAIIGYHKNGEPNGRSTSVVSAKYNRELRGTLFQTKSGSYYYQSENTKNQSIWPLGLQMHRPELYQRLCELLVL